VALTREFFDGLKREVSEVAILNANDKACIRTMSGRERDAYDASINDGKNQNFDNMSARLVVRCLCDEQGELLFPDPATGAETIGEWPTSIVDPLFDACRDLNHMKRGAVEEAAKNSEPSPDDSSSTD
jgi:hypothetical protein